MHFMEIGRHSLESENVLFIENDCVIGNLDLDNLCLSFTGMQLADNEHVHFILVKGNLTAHNIFNKETDGSTGIIVLGNLTAGNILAGGQEIYVSGNLNVHECFWGDYNHGSLKVKGLVEAGVFVATEEYRFDCNREQIKAQYFLCDEEGNDFEKETVERIFEPAIIEDTEDDDVHTWNTWLNRYAAVELLASDKPLLKAEVITQSNLLQPILPGTLPVDNTFAHYIPLWKQWIGATTKIVPANNPYYNLTQGISEEDIKNYALIDEENNRAIPDALVNFYKIHNVACNAVTSAFSFFINNWPYTLIPFNKIAEEWDCINSLYDEDDDTGVLPAYSEKIKTGNYANPGWIPFAEGRNGDYLLFDTAPGDKGKYGQIVELQNESWQRNVVADSLEELLQNEIYTLENGAAEKFEFILSKSKPSQTILPEQLIFNDVHFKVINSAEAQGIIGGLTDFKDELLYDFFNDTSLLPDEENAVFLLAEEDVQMEKLELNSNTEKFGDICIAGFIFRKNLSVNRYINAENIDNPPALIVLGNVVASNIILSSNVHYISGSLTCNSLVGNSAHGALYVKGDVTAWLIHSYEMAIHVARLHAVQAIHCMPYISILIILQDEQENIITMENYFPDTHFLSDIVNDDLVEKGEYGEEKLRDDYYGTPGRSLLSLDEKAVRYHYTNFREQFVAMVNALSTTPKAKADSRIVGFDATGLYTFMVSNYEGETIYRLSMLDEEQYHIRRSGIFNMQANVITLLMEYLDENGEAKYQWSGDETTSGLEFNSIKHAMFRAFNALIKQMS